MQNFILTALTGFVLGIPFAVGTALFVLILPYRVLRKRARVWEGILLWSIPVISAAVAFFGLAWLSAQITILFVVVTECVERPCIPYMPEEIRGAAAHELYLRLIAPPPIQQSCFAGVREACAVADAIVADPGFGDGFNVLTWSEYLRGSVFRTYGALIAGVFTTVFLSRRQARGATA